MMGSFGLLYLGLGFFRESFQSLFGGLVPRILRSLINQRFMAYTVGFLITLLVQSGSMATSSMISFVNAGLMNVLQAASFSLGAQLGTSTTFWLVSLFELVNYNVLIIFGVLSYILSRWQRLSDVSRCLMGLALVFLSMQWMGNTLQKEAIIAPELSNALLVICGLVPTLVFRSSIVLAASLFVMVQIGILLPIQAFMSLLGSHTAFSFLLLFDSRNALVKGKRVALIYAITKFLPVLIAYFFLEFIWGVIGLGLTWESLGIDLFWRHSVFIASTTLLSLLAMPVFLHMTRLLLPEKKEKEAQRLELGVSVHHVAISLTLEQAFQEVQKMAAMLQTTLNLTGEYHKNTEDREEHRKRISKYSKIILKIQKELDQFLRNLLCRRLSLREVERINRLLRISLTLSEIGKVCQKLLETNCKNNSGLIEKVITNYDEVFANFLKDGNTTSLETDKSPNLVGELSDFESCVREIDLKTRVLFNTLNIKPEA